MARILISRKDADTLLTCPSHFEPDAWEIRRNEILADEGFIIGHLSYVFDDTVYDPDWIDWRCSLITEQEQINEINMITDVPVYVEGEIAMGKVMLVDTLNESVYIIDADGVHELLMTLERMKEEA